METTTLEATKVLLHYIKGSGLDYEQRHAALTAALAIHTADSCDVTMIGKGGTRRLQFTDNANYS